MTSPAEAAFQKARACRARGDLRGAIDLYRQAVSLDPHYIQAYSNMGADLLDLGAAPVALAALEVAVALAPDFVEARNNHGNALLHLNRAQEAEADFRHAISLSPNLSQPWTNLGQALLEQNRVDEAIEAHQQAVALNPADADTVNDWACALGRANRMDEALEGFARAIALAPTYGRPRVNYALTLLKLGRWREGWAAYEWRWRTRPQGERPAGPEWTGEALKGRTLLLFCEQGYGDSIQFIRFAPHVLPRDGRVLLRAPARLARLLAQVPGIDQVIAHDQPLPAYDVQFPVMSLPRMAGIEPDDIPSDCPYLHPYPQDVACWADRLKAVEGLKVGLVWSGNPRPNDPEANRLDRRRSVTLADFAPLADVPGLTLISLQKDAAGQSSQRPQSMRLHDWMSLVEDFADSAALISCLDLVVTVDTAVAHLAGALGKPVWVLSRFDGCWRWLTNRDDSPWYPTMRLFRQEQPGTWDAPLRHLVDAIPPV